MTLKGVWQRLQPELKDQLKRNKKDLRELVTRDWLRVVGVLCIIFVLLLVCWHWGDPKHPAFKLDRVLEHLAIELVGALSIFVLLDAGMRVVPQLHTFYLTQEDTLPVHKFLREAKSAREVRVMDIYLDRILADGTNGELLAAFKASARPDGPKLKFLLTVPESQGARQRAEDIAKKDPNFVRLTDEEQLVRLRETYIKMRTNLRELGHLKEATTDCKVTIKLYDALPTSAIYQVDGTMYVSFYPEGQLSADSPQLVVSQGPSSVLWDYLLRPFVSRWDKPEKARELNNEDLTWLAESAPANPWG